MAAETVSPREPIDIQAIVARIDRDFVEARKFREEADKLGAERDKLRAEELKLVRDRSVAPWLIVAGLLGGTLSVVAQVLLHRLGLV